MKKNNSKQKLRTLMIMDILKKYSDDEHPLTSKNIIDELNENGSQCERKSVYSSIDTLIEYGLDINKTCYPYKGFFLGERDFELPEIRLLIDAVLSAKFITKKKTKQLIYKLQKQLSTYQACNVMDQIYVEGRPKFDNEEIYYSIDTINTAISKNLKIAFTCYNKSIKNNKVVLENQQQIQMSPYALMWIKDKYYVAGNCDSYNDVRNYKLDTMQNVKMINEEARHFSEVSIYKSFFNTADYVKKSMGMISENLCNIELICDYGLIELVNEKFGNDIKLSDCGNHKFTVHIDMYFNDELVNWLIQYADKVYVKSPNILREKVANRIRKIYKVYFGKNKHGYL